MMDKADGPSAAICKLCGETFKLPEDEADGNLPRILLCGHIFCTNCLVSIQCEGTIKCPDCEFGSALPVGGVYGLQEESRIIGLIYTAEINLIKSLRCNGPKGSLKNKLSPHRVTTSNTDVVKQPADIEKIERTVDESLVQAAKNLAQLENICETLTGGLSEQVKSERTRLEMEIMQASNKAQHTIQKWKDTQLNQLTKMETQFPSIQAVLSHVRERIKALEIAIQMAKEVRRVPFLEQYCILDKVLETLQTPVDHKTIDLKCISEGTGMSCVFQTENVNQCLKLSLKIEAGGSNPVIKYPLANRQSGIFVKNSSRKHVKQRNSCSNVPSNKLPIPEKQEPESPGASSSLAQGSHLIPKPDPKIKLSHHSSFSDLGSPDVIIEEFIDDNPESVTPTGPEMANNEWRSQKRQKSHLRDKKSKEVTHWVVVTHVVNPSHFYVRYVAEKRENEILSKKINELCCGDGCHFTLRDIVERGSIIFVKWKEVVWCRATVVEVFQKSCVKAVKACPVTQLASLRVIFPDYGFTKSITIQSEGGAAESLLNTVNNHLRKVGETVKVELSCFAPQAIRCSLKDLVPYNLAGGWSEEAKAEFCCVVGSAAVEMRPLGQDRDSLLVDLRKAPMEQSTDVPISVREYLVFIEVARFYSPVTLGRKPLMYYPPVYPEASTELDAVVSHINNLSDFYIQLVDNMESLLLSAKLQDYYNALKEDEFRVYCPVIGQACVAPFEDKLWYRAQVIGHTGGRKVEVQYVDFGNKHVLSVSDLRKIKEEFFALPAMAVHCCLADVIPLNGKSWSEACTKRFISLAHQQLVTVVTTGKVPKTEPLPLGVFVGDVNKPKTSIAELLVKEDLARFKESRLKSKNKKPSGPDSAVWDPPLELGLAPEEAGAPDQVIVEGQNNDPLELQPHLKLPDQCKDLKVMVTHVNSPSSLYVRFTNSDPQLKRICELVKQKCDLMEPQDVVWKADMYCAANINGVWERGQICCDVASNNTAEIRRCDHGNKVKIHVSNLYPLPSSLIGSLAVECTLNDIRPTGGRTTWTDTACDLISFYLTGASALMTVKEVTDEYPLPVVLSCSNRMGKYISIADFLVDKGLALRERKPRVAVVQKPKETDSQTLTSDAETCKKEKSSSPPSIPSFSCPSSSSTKSTCIPPKPFPRSVITAEKVKTSMYHPPELPCPGHILISVSAIGDDGVIYARTQSAEYQLEQLKEGIQKSIKTLPRQKPYTWKSVQGCAVIGPDMLWYRGRLLELLGGHVKVQYVDYGLIENIPVVHVYPMLLCVEVPQLCMPCQLFGINPVGGKWQCDGVALMREVLLNRSVDMQVVELPADPRGPLTVEIFLDGMSLSRILCHNEHASMDGSLSTQKGLITMLPSPLLDVWDISTEGVVEEPVLGPFVNPNLPLEGEHFEVRVTHLWTPNELFLWPLKETADSEMMEDSLDEALARINANITSLPQLTSFLYGGPCLAEYSDGKYYRARLMKFTSIEPLVILVQHVDFGSDDTLPTSKLRQMPAELLLFPTRAIKVKVAGFKAPSVEQDEDVLPYCPAWSVKAVMEMTDLLHNNITATVVSREPELKVQLYDEKGELVHLPLVNSGLAELD